MPRRPLTQPRVDELGDKAALKKATLIRHPSLKGFAVRVYPSGAKSYVIEAPLRSGRFKALPEPFRDASTVPLEGPNGAYL